MMDIHGQLPKVFLPMIGIPEGGCVWHNLKIIAGDECCNKENEKE